MYDQRGEMCASKWASDHMSERKSLLDRLRDSHMTMQITENRNEIEESLHLLFVSLMALACMS